MVLGTNVIPLLLYFDLISITMKALTKKNPFDSKCHTLIPNNLQNIYRKFTKYLRRFHFERKV